MSRRHKTTHIRVDRTRTRTLRILRDALQVHLRETELHPGRRAEAEP